MTPARSRSSLIVQASSAYPLISAFMLLPRPAMFRVQCLPLEEQTHDASATSKLPTQPYPHRNRRAKSRRRSGRLWKKSCEYNADAICLRDLPSTAIKAALSLRMSRRRLVWRASDGQRAGFIDYDRDGNLDLALGEVLMQQGERQAAIAAFEKAVKLAPNDPTFRQNLESARLKQ
ncbi:MAG: tetratricopeptide repeat protein [Blastocatellia bacterium]